jgi:hypothetical protein
VSEGIFRVLESWETAGAVKRSTTTACDEARKPAPRSPHLLVIQRSLDQY